MEYRCELPGTNKFVDYMIGRVKGFLTSKYYGAITIKEGRKEVWQVFDDATKIGDFITTPNSMEYNGRVPGFVNQTIAEQDELRPPQNRRDIDSVHLIYTNAPTEETDEKGLEKKVAKGWRRADKHPEIPFP